MVGMTEKGEAQTVAGGEVVCGGGEGVRERTRKREMRDSVSWAEKKKEKGGLGCTTPLKVLRGPSPLLSHFFYIYILKQHF